MTTEDRGAKAIGIGLLGCGTVGGGVLRLLEQHGEALATRTGAPLAVRGIAVRDLDKPRPELRDRGLLTTDPEAVIDDPGVEVVVEVMGGEERAHRLIERALQAGKSVVTANKLLLAKRGVSLLRLAHEHRVDLAFEGAVGGGIPIVRTLRDALASDRVRTVRAILNGTCNYVLTRVDTAGLAIEDAIIEAQEKGYAEADPTLDVDGHDAAHKMTIVAMLAFGAHVDHDQVHVEGIRGIEAPDQYYAERFGYGFKHLAIGRDHGDCVELRVHSTLIPQASVLANVSDVLNAVWFEGEALGPCLVSGRGAGDLPTAVSVVSDIVDVARCQVMKVPGLVTRSVRVEDRPLLSMAEVVTRHYLRFPVIDQPGVMAKIAGALGDAGVSIEQVVQDRPDEEGEPVQVVMTTHLGREGAVQSALARLRDQGVLRDEPRLYRIEDA